MVPLVLMLSRACGLKEEPSGQPAGAAAAAAGGGRIMPDWAESLLRVLRADESTASRY